MTGPKEPTLRSLPFRGGTLKVWSDTDAGTLAVIAQIGLADPRLDAFYEAAGATLKAPDGTVVGSDSVEEKELGAPVGGCDSGCRGLHAISSSASYIRSRASSSPYMLTNLSAENRSSRVPFHSETSTR